MSVAWPEISTAIEILAVNLLMSGDNAIAVAMVANRLSPSHRTWALGLAALLAIVVRVPATVLLAHLLLWPGVQLVGGLVLVGVAIKLLLDEDQGGDVAEPDASPSLWRAVGLILAADLLMSLDNVVAMAAVSQGAVLALVAASTVGIGMVMFSGGLIAGIFSRWPQIVYVGAAIIAWAAGQMLLADGFVARIWVPGPQVEWVLRIAALAVVLTAPRWWPALTARFRPG